MVDLIWTTRHDSPGQHRKIGMSKTQENPLSETLHMRSALVMQSPQQHLPFCGGALGYVGYSTVVWEPN